MISPCACAVHTHTTLCDGKDAPAEMARAAYEAGIKYLGFSCHSHTGAPMDAGCTLPRDMAEYRAAALTLREEYAGRMEILLGIEWDSCSDVSPRDFDYWIGSVHHIYKGGAYYPVDWEALQLTACCKEQFGGDFDALLTEYWQAVGALAAKKPTILGHIDLITKLNGDGALFDENSAHYRACALAALHTADPTATLLEINTGAMARGYRTAPYPAHFLLEEWNAMGGRVIITSDAHSGDKILYGYAAAIAAAKAAGFSESAILTKNGTIVCPL